MNIAKIEARTEENTNVIDIFVNGCNNACKDCKEGYGKYNNELSPYEVDEAYRDSILTTIRSICNEKEIDVFNIKGGDPLSLRNLSGTVFLMSDLKCAYPNTKISIYTRSTMDYIASITSDMSFVDLIDTIIDTDCVDK